MTEPTRANKVDELEALLNDPNVPLMPDRVWALLAELTHHRAEAARSSVRGV
jgi:hypothetical protein